MKATLKIVLPPPVQPPSRQDLVLEDLSTDELNLLRKIFKTDIRIPDFLMGQNIISHEESVRLGDLMRRIHTALYSGISVQGGGWDGKD